MKRLSVSGALVVSLSLALAGQDNGIKIVWPTAETFVSGPTQIDVSVDPGVAVASMRFTADGQELCTIERRPFRCDWNPGAAVRRHLVRVTATLVDGQAIVATVRTKDVGYTQGSRVDAVLVPVIVTDRGEFVRGLTKGDFEVLEDKVPQTITTLAAEDSPLDLILAIDVSGSMDGALDDVKVAVKRFLAKLRPGDAVTLVGFNDNFWIATERETSAEVRLAAVDDLAAWGGTALYDATIRVLDMVTRENSRRGVVIFSDGADEDSMTTRESATARVRSSDAMLYAIGFGAGRTIPTLRASLEEYAEATGGRAFFPLQISEMDRVFTDIMNELANQYVLSYTSTNTRVDGAWRNIHVRVRKGGYNVRARRGYTLLPPPVR